MVKEVGSREGYNIEITACFHVNETVVSARENFMVMREQGRTAE